MKWFGYILALFCALIAVEVFVNGWMMVKYSGHLEAKDYIAYIQVLITFCTAILLAFFNFSATRSNEQFKARVAREAAAALAELQAKLNVETGGAIEKIRYEFNISATEAAERLRAQLSQSSEDFKARLGQVIPQRYNGYHAMYKAATKYFFALRELETGVFPNPELKSASDSADEAIGSALIVDQQDRDLFFNYLREAKVLTETARKNQERRELQELWGREGGKFGNLYKDLEMTFGRKVRV